MNWRHETLPGGLMRWVIQHQSMDEYHQQSSVMPEIIPAGSVLRARHVLEDGKRVPSIIIECVPAAEAKAQPSVQEQTRKQLMAMTPPQLEDYAVRKGYAAYPEDAKNRTQSERVGLVLRFIAEKATADAEKAR